MCSFDTFLLLCRLTVLVSLASLWGCYVVCYGWFEGLVVLLVGLLVLGCCSLWCLLLLVLAGGWLCCLHLSVWLQGWFSVAVVWFWSTCVLWLWVVEVFVWVV